MGFRGHINLLCAFRKSLRSAWDLHCTEELAIALMMRFLGSCTASERCVVTPDYLKNDVA